MKEVIIYAHKEWIDDIFYLTNGQPPRWWRPKWRMYRIIRRLSRDRILRPEKVVALYHRMMEKYMPKQYPGDYWRCIPDGLNGCMRNWVYRGQTLTDDEMGRVIRYQKPDELRRRRPSQYLYPDGKRHRAKAAFNRRLDDFEDLKLLAVQLDRRIKYAQFNLDDAKKYVRFEKNPPRNASTL